MDAARDAFSGMDIYLIDQVLKGRYESGQRILDAGCGSGRNLNWFSKNGFDIHICDKDRDVVQDCARYWNIPEDHCKVCEVKSLPYEDNSFDRIICSAVVHFAKDHQEFAQMWKELIRVLKPGGSIFARVATLQGLTTLPKSLGSGRYLLNDGTERYLLDRSRFEPLLESLGLEYLEPSKAVNVNDLRSMSVLVLKKAD